MSSDKTSNKSLLSRISKLYTASLNIESLKTKVSNRILRKELLNHNIFEALKIYYRNIKGI